VEKREACQLAEPIVARDLKELQEKVSEVRRGKEHFVYRGQPSGLLLMTSLER
jgi:hypothetical protein